MTSVRNWTMTHPWILDNIPLKTVSLNSLATTLGPLRKSRLKEGYPTTSKGCRCQFVTTNLKTLHAILQVFNWILNTIHIQDAFIRWPISQSVLLIAPNRLPTWLGQHGKEKDDLHHHSNTMHGSVSKILAQNIISDINHEGYMLSQNVSVS